MGRREEIPASDIATIKCAMAGGLCQLFPSSPWRSIRSVGLFCRLEAGKQSYQRDHRWPSHDSPLGIHRLMEHQGLVIGRYLDYLGHVLFLSRYRLSHCNLMPDDRDGKSTMCRLWRRFKVWLDTDSCAPENHLQTARSSITLSCLDRLT